MQIYVATLIGKVYRVPMNKQMNADKAPAQAGKHTPGPWTYSGSMNARDIIVHRDFGDDRKNSLGMNGCDGYVATIRTKDHGVNLPGTEDDANAALIASAPNLLAERDALRTVVVHFTRNYLFNDEDKALVAKALALAQLGASAPAILEALKDAESALAAFCPAHPAGPKARAAIELAEGGK